MSDNAILVTHTALHQHPLLPQHIEDTTGPWRVVARVDVHPPPRESFSCFDEDYPWLEAKRLQLQRYAEIQAAMAEWPDARVLYMGFAPIPLALHLGSLFGQTVDLSIYQHHHRNHDWRWPSDEDTPQLLAPLERSPRRANFDGDVMIRVASSYPVAPEDMRWIAPDGAPEFHLSLARPSPDALDSPAKLRHFATGFWDLLDEICTNFPSARFRHLAAAVPVGAAFAMGQQINPTRHLPIQTWKFLGNRRRRFARALCLGSFTGLPRVLLLSASPLSRSALSGPDEIQELHELLVEHDKRVRVVHKPSVHANHLGTLLEEVQPSVLHLACHGDLDPQGETTLMLIAPGGWSCGVETDDFLRLLRRSSNLLCVLLMSCNSAELARRIVTQSSTAIGWTGPVDDGRARVFARKFWRSLTDGHSVDEAFNDGRLALRSARDQVRLETAEGVDATKVRPIPKP